MAEFNLEVSTEERRRAGAVVDLQVVPGNAISPDGTIARTNTVTPMQNGCPTARHTSISDCVRLDRRHARALNYLLAGILSIFGVSCDSGVKHSESPAGETAQQTPPPTNESMPNANAESASAGSTGTLPTTNAADTTGISRNGWGAVTWGMTEHEVRAVYPAAVAINPPADYDRAEAFATLRLPGVRAAGLDFAALFLFGKSTHKLTRVLLRRDPEQTSEYEQVLAALTDKYGAPSRSKELRTASVDPSSPQQATKTRIGSASAAWLSGDTAIAVEYFEAIGVRYLIVSYKPRSEEPNL